VSPDRLDRRGLFAYAAFALPLAMAALPVYVHVPKFYGDTLGMPLAMVGAILLACRLLDAFQDPLLGYLSDRAQTHPLGRRLLILLSVPLLVTGLIALFHPPDAGTGWLAAWLALALVVVYLGFSMGSISYYALGAELSRDYHERTRITATRGALAVAGVLVAAAVPELLSARMGTQAGLALFSLAFIPVVLAGAVATVGFSPRPAPGRRSAHAYSLYSTLAGPFANPAYRWLILVSVLSGIAAAIPATLILFYVQDVLQRPALSGLFLALYFVFGAAGMPLWIAAARRFGKKRAWLLGMAFSVIAFVWAFLLSAGDSGEFAVVCMLSGLAYGAELAIAPSILADIVDQDQRVADGSRPDGAYFGLWQMVDKLNLALAAGIALPLLGWLGYQPGALQAPQTTLSFMYALVPCGIKLVAVACLWAAPVEARVGPPSALSLHGETTP
jgi:GPH family glycoside/pentoside/hexuronide:cation symporter